MGEGQSGKGVELREGSSPRALSGGLEATTCGSCPQYLPALGEERHPFSICQDHTVKATPKANTLLGRLQIRCAEGWPPNPGQSGRVSQTQWGHWVTPQVWIGWLTPCPLRGTFHPTPGEQEGCPAQWSPHTLSTHNPVSSLSRLLLPPSAPAGSLWLPVLITLILKIHKVRSGSFLSHQFSLHSHPFSILSAEKRRPELLPALARFALSPLPHPLSGHLFQSGHSREWRSLGKTGRAHPSPLQRLGINK